MSQCLEQDNAADAVSHRFLSGVRLRGLAIVAFIGCLLLFRWAHLKDHPIALAVALVAGVAVFAGWLLLEDRRLWAIGWMTWQRCAAAVLMFVVIEAGYRVCGAIPGSVDPSQARSAKVVTYAEAKGDPVAFARWWDVYMAEWFRDTELTQTAIPGGPIPYVFKPNTSRPFLRGQVRINSLGLSDREVPLEKGDKYRIVVMGSSHTQCPPIEADDTPWPEKLEHLIQDRVATTRPVEVLNAGAAGYTMEANLHRLKNVVLPLKPDMVVTYFGYNDYDQFDNEFRMPKFPHTPGKRGSILLRKIEMRFTSWLSERMTDTRPPDDLATLQQRLAQCHIARLYEEYVRVAHEAGIQLVVCNFSMAVDEHSPRDVVDFYGKGFPNVKFMIEANRLNSVLLPLVVRPDTAARLIDVQSDLDGVWEGPYVDLVHLSEAGKARLAENVLLGITELLPLSSDNSDPQEKPSRLSVLPVKSKSSN